MWNLEKQREFDQLKAEKDQFYKTDAPALIEWLNVNCGIQINNAQLGYILGNATKIIEKLKPWSKIS